MKRTPFQTLSSEGRWHKTGNSWLQNAQRVELHNGSGWRHSSQCKFLHGDCIPPRGECETRTKTPKVFEAVANACKGFAFIWFQVASKKFNIIVVDWYEGSKQFLHYYHAASNTRVVGAIVAKWLQETVEQHQYSLDNIHCIGHSLGAQVCSFVGKMFPLARITGQWMGLFTIFSNSGENGSPVCAESWWWSFDRSWSCWSWIQRESTRRTAGQIWRRLRRRHPHRHRRVGHRIAASRGTRWYLSQWWSFPTRLRMGKQEPHILA